MDHSAIAADRARSAAWPAVPPVAVAVLIVLLFAAINPIGYVGAGGDDWPYLQAARCIARNGYCIADTHWAARSPLVMPMGWGIALAGESRAALWIVPFGYAVAATALLTAVVERQFGRIEAVLCGVIFVATPAVSDHVLRPHIDIVELAWMLAAVFALQSALRQSSRRWAAIAGAALAMAVSSRATALAVTPFFGLGLLAYPPARRFIPAFALGFALPLAVALVVSGIATGDPLHGWLLALHHTAIESSALKPGVDLGRSPILNPAFIGGWHRSMGIEVHWTIDPVLNLLANPRIGPVLLAAAALALLGRRDGDPATRKWAKWMLAAAIGYFALLTYVLAIDPLPRMFLPVVAIAATLAGLFGGALWRSGERVAVTLIVLLLIGLGMAFRNQVVDFSRAEPVATAWTQSPSGPVAVTPTTAAMLTLAPAIRALPLHRHGGSGPVLAISTRDCRTAPAELGHSDWHAIRRYALVDSSHGLAGLLRHYHLWPAGTGPALCLFSAAPDRAASPLPGAA